MIANMIFSKIMAWVLTLAMLFSVSPITGLIRFSDDGLPCAECEEAGGKCELHAGISDPGEGEGEHVCEDEFCEHDVPSGGESEPNKESGGDNRPKTIIEYEPLAIFCEVFGFEELEMAIKNQFIPAGMTLRELLDQGLLVLPDTLWAEVQLYYMGGDIIIRELIEEEEEEEPYEDDDDDDDDDDNGNGGKDDDDDATIPGDDDDDDDLPPEEPGDDGNDDDNEDGKDGEEGDDGGPDDEPKNEQAKEPGNDSGSATSGTSEDAGVDSAFIRYSENSEGDSDIDIETDIDTAIDPELLLCEFCGFPLINPDMPDMPHVCVLEDNPADENSRLDEATREILKRGTGKRSTSEYRERRERNPDIPDSGEYERYRIKIKVSWSSEPNIDAVPLGEGESYTLTPTISDDLYQLYYMASKKLEPPAITATVGTPLGVIVGFENLPKDVTEQVVEPFAPLSDVVLPETLSATMRFSYTDGDSPGYDDIEVTVPVEWTSMPAFNSALPGNYIFTPRIINDDFYEINNLSKSLKYAVSAASPRITATVGGALAEIVDFEELPDDVAEQFLTPFAEISDVILPDTIEATMRIILPVFDDGVADDSSQPSGEDEDSSDEDNESSDTDNESFGVEGAFLDGDYDSSSTGYEEIEVTVPVKWICEPEFGTAVPDESGDVEYIFSAQLIKNEFFDINDFSESFEFAVSAAFPEIVAIIPMGYNLGDTIDMSDHTVVVGTNNLGSDSLTADSPHETGELWRFLGTSSSDGYYLIFGDVKVTGSNQENATGGALASQRRLQVAPGASVEITLDDVTITGLGADKPALLLNSGSSVDLILDGTGTAASPTNILTGGTNCAGIQTSLGSITISGEGTLKATGGDGGAGIGGGDHGDGGSITINGGIIFAEGSASLGDQGAGIGGGYYGNCGIININGGDVTAIGGPRGAGIGSGCGVPDYGSGENGIIYITGGVVKPRGGTQAAGIGGSYDGSCPDIIISGGIVTLDTLITTSFVSSIGQGANPVSPCSILLSGNAIVTTYRVRWNIGTGPIPPKYENGIISIEDVSEGAYVVHGEVTYQDGWAAVHAGKDIVVNGILTIPDGVEFEVEGGRTVTINGAILPGNGSTITVSGNLDGTVGKITGANVGALEAEEVDDTWITLKEVTDILAYTGQTGIEYAMSDTAPPEFDPDEDDYLTWLMAYEVWLDTLDWEEAPNGLEYDGLERGTYYWFFARSMGVGDFKPGLPSVLEERTALIPVPEIGNLQIDAPVTKALPDTTATLPTAATPPLRYSVSDVAWWNVTDGEAWDPSEPFHGGKVYKVTITLTPADEYSFNIPVPEGTINGYNTTVNNRVDGDTLELSYTFPATQKISVNITGVSISDSTYNGSAHAGATGTPVIQTAATPPVTVTDIPAGDILYTYTGTENEPAPLGTTYSSSTPPINAGSYTFTISIDDDNPYYTGSTPIQFEIGRIDLSVLPTAGQRKDYGDDDPSPFEYTIDVNNILSGERADGPAEDADLGTLTRVFGPGGSPGKYDPPGDYAFSAENLSLTTNNSFLAGNYQLLIPSTAAKFTIGQATLTVVSGTATKTYDGTKTADVSALTLSVDTLTLGTDYIIEPGPAPAAPEYASKDVADNLATGTGTVTGTVTLQGDAANNYAFSVSGLPSSSTTFTITNGVGGSTVTIAPRTITFTNSIPQPPLGPARYYNGSAVASDEVIITFPSSGAGSLVTGDTLEPGGSSPDFVVTAVYDNQNAGTGSRTVTGTIALTSTTMAQNYTLSTNNLTPMTGLTINRRLLYITGFPTITKNYDGTAAVKTDWQSAVYFAPIPTPDTGMSGLVSGELATVNTAGVTATYAPASIGAGTGKTINFSGTFAITPGAGFSVASNYTIQPVSIANGVITEGFIPEQGTHYLVEAYDEDDNPIDYDWDLSNWFGAGPGEKDGYLVIKPASGYAFSTENVHEDESAPWDDSAEIRLEVETNGIVAVVPAFYVRRLDGDGDGTNSDPQNLEISRQSVSLTHGIDWTPPVPSVTYSNNVIGKFISEISFGLIFSQSTINGTIDLSDVGGSGPVPGSISYHIATRDEIIDYSAGFLVDPDSTEIQNYINSTYKDLIGVDPALVWTNSNTFPANTQNDYYLFVKATDVAGNTTGTIWDGNVLLETFPVPPEDPGNPKKPKPEVLEELEEEPIIAPVVYNPREYGTSGPKRTPKPSGSPTPTPTPEPTLAPVPPTVAPIATPPPILYPDPSFVIRWWQWLLAALSFLLGLFLLFFLLWKRRKDEEEEEEGQEGASA